MKIFVVEHDDAEPRHHATQGGAKKEALRIFRATGDRVDVVACEVMKGKDGIVALANGPGWCVSQEVIYTAGKRNAKVEKETDPWE